MIRSLPRIAMAALAMAALAAVLWADEISDAFDALKKAEAAKNAADVKKWAAETSRLARAEAAKPQPEDASQVEYWKSRVAYAKQTDTYTEYALAAMAAQPGVAPADVVALVETLMNQNPKSVYLPGAVPAYIASLSKAGGAAKQAEGAAKVLAIIPDSEDALFTLAESSLTAQRSEQAFTYASRLLNTLRTKAKPEGVSDADWNTKKNTLTARGYYIAGVASCLREIWVDCDKNLRAALPLVSGQPALAGPTNFYLGTANYQISRLTNSRATLQEAIKFTQAAAAIAGPLQDQARRNVYAMQQELPSRR
jgi:hypothetical protein